jgi:WD40 repeat protein
VYVANGTGVPSGAAHVTDEPTSIGVSPRAVAGSVGVAVGSYYGSTQVLMLTTDAFSAPVRLAANGTGSIWSPSFSPDGTMLASGESAGWVRFWSLPVTATSVANGTDIRFAAGAYGVAYSPAGTHLAVAGGFSSPILSIYDAATRGEVARGMPAPSDDVEAVAFAPNGLAVIAGLYDCGKVYVCATP